MNGPTVPQDALWVRSDVLPNGPAYGVVLCVGADRAWTLDRDQAVAYAAACFARATEAEHDAAVFALFTSLGMTDVDAARVLVRDVRPDRPEDHAATEPLRFTGALGLRVGPFLHMTLDGGEKVGELTPADLRDHAAADPVRPLRPVRTAGPVDRALRRGPRRPALRTPACDPRRGRRADVGVG